MEGNLTKLRPLEQQDSEILFSWYRDLEVTDLLDIDLPVGMISIIDMITKKTTSTDTVGFMVEDRKSDIPIGVIMLNSINWVDRKAELGIMIGDKGYWSKGYGEDAAKTLLGYAFNRLDLHRIFLKTYSFNERAIRCFEKCGFKEEGRLRAGRYWKGKRHDVLVMSMISDEFLEAMRNDQW